MTGYADLNPHGPRLRKVVAGILMDIGWLHGTFHVPERQTLIDYFATGVPLLKTTRVRFPGINDLVPFIALRREAITLIDPTIDDDMVESAGSGGRTTPHRVSCYLTTGLLHGSLEVLVNVRLSDFLRQQTGMLVIRDCLVVPYGEPVESPKARRMRVTLLNMGRALGVGEPDKPA
jgi:hypothetical protein